MTKRDLSNLDLKIKLTNEYLNNGGIEHILDSELLEEFLMVTPGQDGKVDPDTVSSRVNAFMLTILASHIGPPTFSSMHLSEYASTLQKSYSIDQQNIDTPNQFDIIYEEYKNKTGFIFRGQREAKWRLYNSLQRHWLLQKLFESENYEALIKRLIATGKADYLDQIRKLFDTHNVDIENDVAILGYLQHHGCPTPLMDWTLKFQSALFFALDGLTPNPQPIEIQNYCSVYFIDEKYLSHASMRYLINVSLDAVEKPELMKVIASIAKDEPTRIAMEKKFGDRKLFDRKRFPGSGLVTHMTKIEHIINTPILYFSDDDSESGIIFSLKNSMNILNQSGVFLWNYDPAKPIELIGDEQYRKTNGKKDYEDVNYHFCNCFNIHKSLETHIRARLEADGITRDFIYPTQDVSTWDVFKKSINNKKT
jgi:hypothetical protein